LNDSHLFSGTSSNPRILIAWLIIPCEMSMIPVSSSAIRAVGYDGHTLRVEFHGGRSYDHPGVPQYKFEGLINASSPGRYYNDNIRGRY